MLIKKFSRLFFVALVGIVSFGLLNFPGQTFADFITNRSITLSSALPSVQANHAFQMTIPTTANLGSIVFEYCSNSPITVYPCVAPSGMDATAAILAAQAGNTGFSIDNINSTANKLVLTRTVSSGIITPSAYQFNNITNPSTPGQTVFVRIYSYSSTDGSGAYNDRGAVAFSIQSVFNIGAYVPPFLKLCVGISVAPNCSSQTGDSIDLGTLSENSARSGVSQFSTATNDPSGYVIYALGTTMTSGNNIIPALNLPAASFPGTGQFGINLRANLIPSIGQEPVGVGTGAPTANYNIPNRYTFSSGDSITSSSLPSDYNRMTVSYIVNIPSKQPPGVYATTITYVATVQF